MQWSNYKIVTRGPRMPKEVGEGERGIPSPLGRVWRGGCAPSPEIFLAFQP